MKLSGLARVMSNRYGACLTDRQDLSGRNGDLSCADGNRCYTLTVVMPRGEVGPARVYRFGVFELDARSGELRKHGIRLRLQDQPRQILLLLLEHGGEIVTREEIEQRLWSGKTFVDFDNAINSAVRKLRQTLGDSAENPRFVETLARRGYRFIAPVSTEPEALPRPTTIRLPAPNAGPRWRAVPRTASVGIVAVGTLAMVWLVGGRGAPEEVDLRVTPLTTYPGYQLQPSFSTDGTRIAFSWGGPDGQNADIFLKLIGPGDPVRLTTDPALDFSPAWSPDGRWIAALRDLGRQERAVLLIPASGGPQREVARLTAEELGGGEGTWGTQTIKCSAYTFGPMLAWSPDGRFLFTSARNAPGSPIAIVRINVESGKQQPVTVPPRGSDVDVNPAVSPDGRVLAFVRASSFAMADIYTISLSEGGPIRAQSKRLTNDGVNAGGPAWTPDGRELIFSSDRGGRPELWRVPASGHGNPVRLAFASEDAYGVAVSPLAHRLAYGRETYSASLWKVPIVSDAGEKPVRVTTTTRWDLFPSYSPDGKRIVFQSNRSGVHEIWVCDADGSNAVPLTSFGRGWSGSPRWSPDGGTIVFDSNAGGNWEIWTIHSDGGGPVRLTTNPADDVRPSWSRDGQWIYFASTRTGQDEIWKMRNDGSSETQVTTGGGWAAYESADGRNLYYKGLGDEAPLWKVPVEGGTPTKVTNVVRDSIFAPTERGVYFAGGPATTGLRFFDFASGSVRVVASVGAPLSGTSGLEISPDGRWVLYSRPENAGTNLMLVENFR
jgi:Tol biopolymer transport system component/DNA-binding winged helix-turn-helix (wHTH) protein